MNAMKKLFKNIRQSLASKLILLVGVVLLISISTWSFFNIRDQKKKLMHNVVAATDRLTNTVRLGTRYAMMFNSRDDINNIINNIGKQPGIINIRIYNKKGEITYSNNPAELNNKTNIMADACEICHKLSPPITKASLEERTRIFHSPKGVRLLGIISPICNDPSCSTSDCHVHPKDKKILGALDLVVSLENTDKEILHAEKGIIGLAVFVFLFTSAIIFVFVLVFVNRPIKHLIRGTGLIAKGRHRSRLKIKQKDELGLLARAINQMGDEIALQQEKLNNQRDEYQNLFEGVPCLITVQDRNYRLLRYNREFAEKFDPVPGDHCFHAYKGRNKKCRQCPVEKTFLDGKSYETEESGVHKDGSVKHWIVKTSPVKNAKGEIVAAMEISLDISGKKQLEVELGKSEKKYHAIFSNIPNPVFVLDLETLTILDCNKSVESVYNYEMKELIGQPFITLFPKEEQEHYAIKLATASVINQASHVTRDHQNLFVNIRISPSEYAGKKVLLVTTSDVTKRLETEQQLIQASKMATLGEMATGIAHELNQPLSVIKTASSFFIKKMERKEELDKKIQATMLTKVDTNVDRATKIINHMRQFARKSNMKTETVHINDILKNAFEIFSQQLKVRGISVEWDMADHLPRIKADAGRLEQVFINLLLNARDAIEEKAGQSIGTRGENHKTIRLVTCIHNEMVECRVCDTGTGIPDDIAQKIFEPFFTTKDVGKGTGLGLSISYGIIKECGGAIEVQPGRSQGTCFVITFPFTEQNNGYEKA